MSSVASQGRETQLPPSHYGRVWSKMLVSFYHAPNHPAKFRLLRHLERIMGDRRIVAPTKWGFHMALDSADFVQRTIFWEGEYEPEITRLLSQELTSDDILFDIGANVGYYTCAALVKGVKLVYAFEPDPLACSVLHLNLQLNGLTQYRLGELALGAKCGTQSFYRSHVSNTGQSGLQPRNTVASFNVRMETIDSIISSTDTLPPTILKIDVEGLEYGVLLGAQRLLKERPPRLILFEAPSDLLTSRCEHPLTTYLRRYGYTIEHLVRTSAKVEEVENYAAWFTTGNLGWAGCVEKTLEKASKC